MIVSSAAYKMGSFNWEDIMAEKNYNAVSAYGASKLANIYHCTELAKRLEGNTQYNILVPKCLSN